MSLQGLLSSSEFCRFYASAEEMGEFVPTHGGGVMWACQESLTLANTQRSQEISTSEAPRGRTPAHLPRAWLALELRDSVRAEDRCCSVPGSVLLGYRVHRPQGPA